MDTRATASTSNAGAISCDAEAVWIYRFDEHGRGSAGDLSLRDIDLTPTTGWLWLHLDLADIRVQRWLNNAPTGKQVATFLLGSDTHQQLRVAQGYVFGALTDRAHELSGTLDEFGQLRFVATEQILISGRRNALQGVDAARRQVDRGGTFPAIASLLEAIVEQIAEAGERIHEECSAELDEIEDLVLSDEEGDERRRVALLRRRCVRLHRQLTGLRALFHRLERETTIALPASLRVEAARLAQRLDGLDQAIVSILERARSLQDEIAAKQAELTNKHLHTLSVLTIIFLPPSLVAGIFGMNTKGLPLTEDDSGFWWSLLICFLPLVPILWGLRRMLRR
ncbi:CorA family divalent cation transporter [Roseiterribacter gracilis]|uniref:Magnesium transporter CorA n=1 Tax=Roseiterribacter gracilis TaxID=2812848 RepID=A0A8S8XCM8_9PROT|nr:hypothetical protein TMPK1_12470 [Rhodospirillales bacterium TMPK1]